MLKDGGLFIVTSCNWTEEELKSHFEPGNLMVHSCISQEMNVW